MCSQAHSLTALVSVSISPDSLEPCEAKYSSCSLLYICYCAYREYKEVLGMCQVFFQRRVRFIFLHQPLLEPQGWKEDA
jgi:hypothetical protein